MPQGLLLCYCSISDVKEIEGEERGALTHSARPGEVCALHHALPHLAAEQANTHSLQVLRGDLQKHSRPLEL